MVISIILCLLKRLKVTTTSQSHNEPESSQEFSDNAPKDIEIENFVQLLFDESNDYQLQCSLQSNVGGSEKRNVTEFTARHVIQRFKKQSEKTQFAVLLLLSEEKTRNNHIHYRSNLHGKPVVDSSKPYMPTSNDFDNYIVARPAEKGTQHAEQVIFQHFKELWQAYYERYKHVPASIYLYSWLMPCTECTGKVIDMQTEKELPVTVVYTGKNFNENATTQKENRDLLKEKGISVYRVPSLK